MPYRDRRASGTVVITCDASTRGPAINLSLLFWQSTYAIREVLVMNLRSGAILPRLLHTATSTPVHVRTPVHDPSKSRFLYVVETGEAALISILICAHRTTVARPLLRY